MHLNLPDKINNSDIYINNPFTIFEIKNFFDTTTFQNLSNEFPNEEYFSDKHNLGNKKYFNNKDSKFSDFLIESPTFRQFYLQLNSKEFVDKIFHFCKSDLATIPQRNNIKKILLKKNSRENLLEKIKKKINQVFGIYHVRVGFEFSLMKYDSYIPPHNDVENKLISLMIYFPTKEMDSNNNFGTNFYKSTNQNPQIKWKGDMMNIEESENFYNKNSIFHHSQFTENKLVGFLKSDNSWHDVLKLNTKEILRKSLNINLYKL